MTVGELKAQLKVLMEELAPTRPHFILEEEIGINLTTFHFTPALAQKRFGIGAEYFAIGTDIDISNTFIKRRQFDISRHCNDGLQRLTAVLNFINGKFEIFGGLRYEDILNSPDKSKNLGKCNFDIYYLSLQTNKEVIDFYVDFNTGGTPHTKEEIERVKNLI